MEQEQHPTGSACHNAALRERKVQLHDALEPFVAAKIRGDGVVDFNDRGQSHEMAFIASLDLNVATPTLLSLEQCEQGLQYIAESQAWRRATR
ncbi:MULTISPECIES: hypothetical protein [Cupriavidus]|nr:hypothetical protein [Cupriavidus taiwanensis]